MPTTIDSSGITFNDTSTITSANTFIAKPASPSNGDFLGYNGSIWTGVNLNTLLNTLSTNIMNTVGNNPYLEYAWVTAPNTARQTLLANTTTALTIDTEVVDEGNNGSISGNQITLAAGTYYFEAYCAFNSLAGEAAQGIMGLYNVSNGSYISRKPITYYSNNGDVLLNGRFKISSSSIFELRCTTHAYQMGNASWSYNYQGSLSTNGLDQRTTIKLWKVG